ncbi:MAG: macro domain-containing protein [Planctomycetes bacterium]|nr:macro domain-containing protein [Planctomycetota bacterium]
MIEADVGGRTLQIVRGDITAEQVDAIVTAANRLLCGGDQAGWGGGVDGAIHRAAGPELLAACAAIGGCAPGDAVATIAGRLRARRVIHAVGPIWGAHGGAEDALLASAHRRSLEVAEQEGCESVAFPAISCGVYKFPLERAAPIALGAVRDHLVGPASRVRLVRYCLFGDRELEAFAAALRQLAGGDGRVKLAAP